MPLSRELPHELCVKVATLTPAGLVQRATTLADTLVAYATWLETAALGARLRLRLLEATWRVSRAPLDRGPSAGKA